MPILNPFYFTVSSFPTLANHQYTYICNLVNKDKFAGQNWILYKFWVGLVNKNWEKSLICNGREAMLSQMLIVNTDYFLTNLWL